MIGITYYAKEIITCDDPLKSNAHIAKQYAGRLVCPDIDCANTHAVVINDTDEPKGWHIECGDCDLQIYGVTVVVIDDEVDWYARFPESCPCPLCTNDKPDDEYCWAAGLRITHIRNTHRITMHISASASQEASCNVPMAVIMEGRQAVFEYIVHNYDTDYTDYDHDNLDNEGFSWRIRNDEVTEALKHDTYYGFMIPEEKEVIE